jgi:hypothetical protein
MTKIKIIIIILCCLYLSAVYSQTLGSDLTILTDGENLPKLAKSSGVPKKTIELYLTDSIEPITEDVHALAIHLNAYAIYDTEGELRIVARGGHLFCFYVRYLDMTELKMCIPAMNEAEARERINEAAKDYRCADVLYTVLLNRVEYSR